MKSIRHRLPLLAALALCGALPVFGQGTGQVDKKNYIHTLTMADRLRVAVYQSHDASEILGHVDRHFEREMKEAELGIEALPPEPLRRMREQMACS